MWKQNKLEVLAELLGINTKPPFRAVFFVPYLTRAGYRLLDTAQCYGKSAAQVILRFFIQDNVVVIPKSLKRRHIEDNFRVFDFSLDEEDMLQIRSMDTEQTLFFRP